MRNLATALIAAAAIAATPALAQERDKGGGGRGTGADSGSRTRDASPMSDPGRRGDAREAARDIANQRGGFGRESTRDRQMTQAEQAQLYRERAMEYRANSETRRAAALAHAQEAREGRGGGQSAEAIRDELKRDMSAWRDAFAIRRDDWQVQRDQWLVARDSLTPAQWAEQRAAWFAARDAWIARQKAWAEGPRGN